MYRLQPLCQVGVTASSITGDWCGLYCHRTLCAYHAAAEWPLYDPQFRYSGEGSDLRTLQSDTGSAFPYPDAGGDYDKPHIRQIAEEIGLPVATKHDSHDICFVPDHDYASFIAQETGKESKPGNFVDEEGNIMGRHRGLIHYTIGQRKGLGISSSTPIFVKELRPQTNEVVLCKSERLFSRDCHVDNINYMAEEKLTGPVKAIGKIRYSHAGAPCTLYPQPDGTLLAQFDEPQRAMTPGQAAVFYQDDHVLCGGTIETE